MKRFTLLGLLALPILTWSQGKFYGGVGQGWAMETLLNQSLAVGVVAQPTPVQMTVYPNPVASHLRLANFQGEAPYTICDVLGREISHGIVKQGVPIDVSMLQSGWHAITVAATTRKFLKQ